MLKRFIHKITKRFNPRVVYTLSSLLIVATGALIAIQYAKGSYRLTQDGFSATTGILSANSFPTGAEVVINDRLVSATDDTIYLEPGKYNVEIRKEGFSPWKKNVAIQRELVTQTNAQLFPVAPSLAPLSFTGVQNISPSPDGQKLIYYTASASAQTRNGLYLLELGGGNLPFQRGVKQITDDSNGFSLSTAQIVWSPDSTEVLLIDGEREVLLDLSRLSTLESLPDVGLRSKQIFSQWEAEMYQRERQYLKEFPFEVIEIATQSAQNVYFSPDKKRLLYTATAAATIPEGLIPPVPASNTQPEERILTPGNIYVYDREEDKNFLVGSETAIIAGKQAQAGQMVTPSAVPTDPKLTPTQRVPAQPETTVTNKFLLATDLFNAKPLSLAASPSAFLRLQASDSAQIAKNFNVYHTSLYANTFQWLADSRHLLWISPNRIEVQEYDGTNATNIYSGPYFDSFVYPWPDGSRLLILTSFSPDTPNNLYAIELR